MPTCNLPTLNRFTDAHLSGLRVFPVIGHGKKPALPWKQFVEQEPTTNQLADWDAGDYNVGVICGPPSGIAVLDVDSPEAQTFVDGLNLPATPVVSTGRGRHYYFKLPTAGVRNSTGIGGHKLDLRGDGGYVVGHGSIHESGRRYEWLVSPVDVAFAEFPEQLLLLVARGSVATSITTATSAGTTELGAPTRFDRYLKASLDEAVAAVRKADEGGRNDALFRAGVRLANDVAGAGATWASFAATLEEAALAVGLAADEVAATLASCWRSGSEQPTPWMMVARQWVYLSAQDVFYHTQSGNHVKVSGFNGTFGCFAVAKGAFHRFLLDGDFVAKFQDLTYYPATPERSIERDALTWLNTHRPSGVEPVVGDWAPFEDYIAYLVPDDLERGHLLKMIAWTVRNPGQKLRHALLFRSEEQGIGKSMLIQIWGDLLGEHNVKSTTTEEINGNYQGFLNETLLVVVEELNRGVGPTVYNRMKEWITGDIVRLNEKHLAVRAWPNLATFVFLTNLKTPIIIEDRDRRIFFIDSPAKKRPSSYYREYVGWWRGNLGVIRGFLDTIDLTEFDPFAEPPMTSAKRNLISDGREDLVRELATLIDERVGAFDRDIVTLEEINSELGTTMRMKTKMQLREALVALGAQSFGQQRVAGGWEFGRFIPSGGRKSLWAIRNARFWDRASSQARGDEFGRGTGQFANLHGLPIELRHMSEWPA